MMEAAMNSGIDLILTKSISRFARNTVDTLQAIRQLKEKGIEVRFEKEHLNTLDPKCEVMLTIMSSLAQEESRSISENVRWGRQRSMQKGKVSMPFKRFLGYKKGVDGKIEIDEEEAVVVRRIYDDFINGRTISYIADSLTEDAIPTPGGKKKWSVSTVRSILSNEKYKGDALLQKTIVVNYLTKEVKKNEGDARQYYISNSHPAIIPPDQFDYVQLELERRCSHGSKLNGSSPFTGKLICGDCGAYFGYKVYHSKDKYRTEAFACNERYRGKKVCETPVIKLYQLKKAFLTALEKVLKNKAAYEFIYESELRKLSDISALEIQRTQAEEALQGALDFIQVIIRENTQRKQDQTEYLRRYNAQKDVVDEKKRALDAAKRAILEQTAKKEKLRRFMEALRIATESADQFNDDVFTLAIDKVLVEKGESGILVFCFADGTEITVKMVD